MVKDQDQPTIGRASSDRGRLRHAWRLLIAGAVVVMSLLLGACGGDDESTSAGDTEAGGSEKPGGEVTFLNVPGLTFPGEYEDVANQLGITVNDVPSDYTAGVAAVANKIIQTPEDYDLALLDASQMPRLEANDLLARQDSSTVPNLDLIQPQSIVEQAAGGVPLDVGKVGIAYRKDLVDQPPQSWADFWELTPQYSGKVVFLNDERSAMGAALRYLGYSANTQDEAEIEEAKNKILEIRPDFFGLRTFDVLKPLISGSAVMAMTFDYEIPPAQEANENIEWVFPEEGTAGFIDDLAVIEGGNTTAAEAFLNWRLEPKNYAKYINATSLAPIVPEALPMIDPAIKNNPAMAFDAGVLGKVEFTQDVGEALPLYTRAWEEVRAG